jgi:predicted peroxiredoxin
MNDATTTRVQQRAGDPVSEKPPVERAELEQIFKDIQSDLRYDHELNGCLNCGICTATAGRLMKKGVAESLFVKPGSPKSVYDFIKDAHEAGAKFYCCSPNLDLFDMTKEDLIPECEGIVGGAYLIQEDMENDDCKVMTY